MARATARPLNVGRSFVVVVVAEVRDDEGRLVAHVTQTQAVLRGDARLDPRGWSGPVDVLGPGEPRGSSS